MNHSTTSRHKQQECVRASYCPSQREGQTTHTLTLSVLHLSILQYRRRQLPPQRPSHPPLLRPRSPGRFSWLGKGSPSSANLRQPTSPVLYASLVVAARKTKQSVSHRTSLSYHSHHPGPSTDILPSIAAKHDDRDRPTTLASSDRPSPAPGPLFARRSSDCPCQHTNHTTSTTPPGFFPPWSPSRWRIDQV